MKMGLKATVLSALVLLVAVPTSSFAQAKYHIGIVTGTVSQTEDDLRGAEAMIKEYGDVKNGGMIQHLTYPNNFMAEQQTTISQIVSLANDPLMKAIVMNQAVPGAAEGFRRVREMRPDILLLGGVPQEDPLVVAKTADLIMRNDFVSAGYRVVWWTHGDLLHAIVGDLPPERLQQLARWCQEQWAGQIMAGSLQRKREASCEGS